MKSWVARRGGVSCRWRVAKSPMSLAGLPQRCQRNKKESGQEYEQKGNGEIQPAGQGEIRGDGKIDRHGELAEHGEIKPSRINLVRPGTGFFLPAAFGRAFVFDPHPRNTPPQPRGCFSAPVPCQAPSAAARTSDCASRCVSWRAAMSCKRKRPRAWQERRWPAPTTRRFPSQAAAAAASRATGRGKRTPS